MGVAALQIRIMPESIDVNLEELKKKVEEEIIKLGGKLSSSNEENIAFGLKALIITIAWPEEKETSVLESELSSLDKVSSAQIIDYRRAFG